jgi:multidrug transporter EmrE-like cation transporter
MSPLKIVAIVLVVAGVLGLAYGSFTYVTGTHGVDLGVVDATWKDRETVNVPVWAGVVAIAAGVVMLFTRKTA